MPVETTFEELNQSDSEATQIWRISELAWGCYDKKWRAELLECVSETTECEGEGNEQYYYFRLLRSVKDLVLQSVCMTV